MFSPIWITHFKKKCFVLLQNDVWRGLVLGKRKEFVLFSVKCIKQNQTYITRVIFNSVLHQTSYDAKLLLFHYFIKYIFKNIQILSRCCFARCELNLFIIFHHHGFHHGFHVCPASLSYSWIMTSHLNLGRGEVQYFKCCVVFYDLQNAFLMQINILVRQANHCPMFFQFLDNGSHG